MNIPNEFKLSIFNSETASAVYTYKAATGILL